MLTAHNSLFLFQIWFDVQSAKAHKGGGTLSLPVTLHTVNINHSTICSRTGAVVHVTLVFPLCRFLCSSEAARWSAGRQEVALVQPNSSSFLSPSPWLSTLR